MAPPRRPKKPSTARFNANAFLSSPGVTRKIAAHAQGTTIFSQGDPANAIFYIQDGRVKLSVLSRTGREAVVGVLGPGDFFGEGALAGQSVRLATATTMTASTILSVPKRQMIGLLRASTASQTALSRSCSPETAVSRRT